jgi:hypothetical protein
MCAPTEDSLARFQIPGKHLNNTVTTPMTTIDAQASQISPVIALTGPFGAGLTTAAQRMRAKNGYQYVSVSDGLRREWVSRYESQVPARSDLQRLGDELRQSGGPGAIVDSALAHADLDFDAPIVIESLKNVGEISNCVSASVTVSYS